MLFPDFFNFYKTDVLFLLMACGLCVFVIGRFIIVKKIKGDHVIVALGAVVISVGHAWSDYESFIALRHWNNLDPNNIMSIQIEPSERLEPSGGKTVLMSEKSIIQRGIQTLVHAQADATFYRALKDGYRLKFQITDKNAPLYLYLSVYRVAFNDFTDVPISIIIPHGESRPDKRKAYRCPEFHEWIRQYVDPLFAPEAQPEAEMREEGNPNESQ